MPPSTASTPSVNNHHYIFNNIIPAVDKYYNIVPSIGSHHPSQHISTYRGMYLYT